MSAFALQALLGSLCSLTCTQGHSTCLASCQTPLKSPFTGTSVHFLIFVSNFLCLESTIFISELKIKQKSAVACAGWEGKDKAGKKGVAPTLYSNKSAPAD